jgi:hypothetical protein
MEMKPSLYVIYNELDMELVDRLVKSLLGKGLRVNYDLRLPDSTEIRREALEKRISQAGIDCLLILFTRNSYSSELFSWDIGFAMEMVSKSNGNQTIIPVIYGEMRLDERLAGFRAINWRDNAKGGFEQAVDNIAEEVERFSAREFSQNIENAEPEVEFSFSGKTNYWILAEGMEIDEAEFETGIKTLKESPQQKLFKSVINETDQIKFDQMSENDGVLMFVGGNFNVMIAEAYVSIGPGTTDEKEGQWIEITAKEAFTPPIPLAGFADKIAEIVPQLQNHSTEEDSIFPIDEATYHAILSSKTLQEEIVVHDYQPFYLTEGDFAKTQDQLDFENDYNSFASVIALKTVTPPLAIGLFGNWGSGKSFFMEKLMNRIKELTDQKFPDYVDNVVHVQFNSWHYSDTNLWASMITEIFDRLHDFATDKKYGPDAVKQIYEQLNITSQQLEETQKKIDEQAARETELNRQKTEIEKEIIEKKERLKGWKSKNYLNVALSDPVIQADFQKIKKQFGEEKLIDNIDQIQEKVVQFDSEWSKLVEAFSLLKKMRKGNWKWIWFLAVIIIISTIVVTIPCIKDWISKYINIAVVYTGLILTWTGNFIAKISPWYEKVRQFYLRIKSLKNTVDKEQENVKLKEQEELARINQEISDLNARKAELETERQSIIQKKTTLEDELKQIGSGKRLSDFLAAKTSDDLYQKQLGIISWIRKDFKKLNDLFEQQKSANKKDNQVPIEVKIDRIVLYIDDLDRCNEDVVVKVLEAIHLLLAFPLFVVIVGVDPRWLNNALSEKYRTLFGAYNNNSLREPEKQSKQKVKDEVPLLTGKATSYDYLEKIFQIPFALKPINKTGREKLIAALMEKEMKQPVKDGATQNPVQETGNQGDTQKTDSGDHAKPQPSDAGQEQNQVTTETDQQRQEQAKRVKEKLEFTTDERDYMQKISALFGRTPRSINRYINIYRIIKAHGSLKITGDFSEDEYVPIMFILGVIVGYSSYAEGFIAEIANSNDNDSFKEFIDKSALDQKLKDEINKLSADVKGIVMKDFKRNLDLIARFSFRSLIRTL